MNLCIEWKQDNAPPTMHPAYNASRLCDSFFYSEQVSLERSLIVVVWWMGRLSGFGGKTYELVSPPTEATLPTKRLPTPNPQRLDI